MILFYAAAEGVNALFSLHVSATLASLHKRSNRNSHFPLALIILYSTLTELPKPKKNYGVNCIMLASFFSTMNDMESLTFYSYAITHKKNKF